MGTVLEAFTKLSYTQSMTFSERNTFIKAGIAFCALCALFVLAVSFLTMPIYPLMGDTPQTGYTFHYSIALSVLFSIIVLSLIYYYFEQTSAPELVYIVIFTISFSFEAIRLILPLHLIYNFPSLYLLLAARTLLFVRYFGIFALFAASICAAGLEVQRVSNVLMLIALAAVIITFSAPIDTANWDTGLNISILNSFIFILINIVLYLITAISFFIAVNVRGSKDYLYVGTGVVVALIGKNIMLLGSHWLILIPGIIMLSAGTWFMCSKLHQIHLWL